MRKFDFISNPNGFTVIMLDGVELAYRINPYEIREYRYHLGKQYSIGFAYKIIEDNLIMLAKEITLSDEESQLVIKYLKTQLGI